MAQTIYKKYLKVTPYDFQKVGIEFALSRHYCIIGDEMGLGKTLQGIAVSQITRSKTLVICPAFLKYNWREEFGKFSNNELKISIDRLESDSDVVITNYARLASSEEFFKWAELVIADEVHYLKNIKAERTKAFHQYLYDHRPSRFLGMSGTPITGKVPDWYSLLMLTSYNPHNTSGLGIDGVDYYRFCNKFCNVRVKKIRGRPIREFYGIKNLEGLRKLLRGKYIRRRCKDVLDLKKIYEQIITLEKNDLDKNYVEEMEDPEKAWMTVKSKSAASKAPGCIDLIKNLRDTDNSPIIVFSDHREPVDVICKGLKGLNVSYINGDVSNEDRHKTVKFFQEGRIDVLVCTIPAASTGLTLTKSNRIIFNDLSANPAQNAQALKRVHRIGQDKPVFCYYLSGNKMDKKIITILKQKMKVLREAS